MLAFLQRSVPAPSRRTGAAALIIGTVLALPAWLTSVPLPLWLLDLDTPLSRAWNTAGELDQLALVRITLAITLLLWTSFALLVVAAVAVAGRALRPLGAVLVAGLVLALPAARAAADVVTAPVARSRDLLPLGVENIVLPLALASAISALVACASRDQTSDPRRVIVRAALMSALGTAVLSLVPLVTLLPVAALALALAYAVTRGPQPIAASILRLSSSVSK